MGTVYVGLVIEYPENGVYRPFLRVRPDHTGVFGAINDSYALSEDERSELRATVHSWTRAQYDEVTDTIASEMLCADLHRCEVAAERWCAGGRTVPAEFEVLMKALGCLPVGARLVYWWEQS